MSEKKLPDQFSFKDHSERKYFSMIPHAITEIDLKANEIAVYLAIKRSAGENANCTKSRPKLAKHAGVCQRSIFNIIQKLCCVNKFLNKPLIICNCRFTENGDKDTNLIEIVDIWHESNMLIEKIYGSATLAPPHANVALGHAKYAGGVMQELPEGHARVADKEEPFNNNPIEEENIARSAISLPPSKKNTLHFDFSSNKFIGIEKEDLEAWKEIYPEINLGSEILKAIEWLKSNPTKSHKKNWRKFLTGWFSRSNEKTENKKAYRSGSKETDRRTKNTDGTPITSLVDGRF